MSGPQATFGIAIVADDKTDKGARSAEKRLGQVPKRFGAANRKELEEGRRSIARHGREIVGTFGSIERSSAKIFGGNSVTSAITQRLSAVREVTSAVGTTFGQAATSGSSFGGAISLVGRAASITLAVVTSLAAAAYKLGDSWAKTGAQIGRTAQTIGVTSQALTEFQAAGERAGVDKDAATGAMGGIAQTINDAYYGRNEAALGLLDKLKMSRKVGADGQTDTVAMAMDLADRIAMQRNPQSKRKLAAVFGISDAALPMFAQGSAQLRADMRDADVHAGVFTNADTDRARRIDRKGAIFRQRFSRDYVDAGRRAGGTAERVYDKGTDLHDRGVRALGTFSESVQEHFAPAARMIEDAARRMEHAALGRGSAPSVSASMALRAQDAMRFYQSRGKSRAQAAGLVAGFVNESGLNPHRVGDGGFAYGLGQWHPNRQADFRRIFGHDIRQSNGHEQLAFADWELSHTEAAAGRALARARSPYGAGSTVSRTYERPADREGQAAERGALAERLAQLPEVPVRVDVHLHGGPPGTRATVTAGRSRHPAISHAMQH